MVNEKWKIRKTGGGRMNVMMMLMDN